MTVKEVVNKLSLEMAFQTGNIENMRVYKQYLTMALSIGIDHFTINMEEVVAMTRDGVETGRYKSITDAAKKLGLDRKRIQDIIDHRQVTTGGYTFILAKDQELVKKNEELKRKEIEFSNDREFHGFTEHN